MRVSPVNLKILAYTLDVEGFDASEALRQCGIPSADALQDDGEWLPATVFDRMMAAALETTGDAAFGLVAGKSLALMRYGAITPLVLPTPSLRQLLADLQRFACLSVEHSEIELQETARGARLRILPVVSQGRSGHFRMEQVATSAVQMLKFVGASSADIHWVDFPYAAPAGQRHRYEATFGPRIAFDSKDCGIDFNPALLDARIAASADSARVQALSLIHI